MNTVSNDLERLGDDVVIARYTDEQAVEDGVLVKVGPRDRVTRAVWDFFVQHVPLGLMAPQDWPVDLGRWVGGLGTEQERDTKAAALALGIMMIYGAAARRVYEQNIGGGIWKAEAFVGGDGTLTGLVVAGATHLLGENPTPGSRRLWLIPNENGGLTLMFPEDY